MKGPIEYHREKVISHKGDYDPLYTDRYEQLRYKPGQSVFVDWDSKLLLTVDCIVSSDTSDGPDLRRIHSWNEDRGNTLCLHYVMGDDRDAIEEAITQCEFDGLVREK